MRTRVAELVRDGVTVVVLLALSDDGVPAYDHHEAAALSALGRRRPGLHAGRLPRAAGRGARRPGRADLARWAAERGLTDRLR